MVKVSCLCRVDVLLKLSKVRFQVRFRRDTLVDGVIDLDREALGEFTLNARTLEGAGGRSFGRLQLSLSIAPDPIACQLALAIDCFWGRIRRRHFQATPEPLNCNSSNLI